MQKARQSFTRVTELIPESELGLRAGDYLDMLQ
jgi:hypothetical protein